MPTPKTKKATKPVSKSPAKSKTKAQKPAQKRKTKKGGSGKQPTYTSSFPSLLGTDHDEIFKGNLSNYQNIMASTENAKKKNDTTSKKQLFPLSTGHFPSNQPPTFFKKNQNR